MSLFADPRDYIDVESQPCQIGTGDCTDLADGTCEECGKLTCRSCALEIEGGYLRCVDCQSDLEQVTEKEEREAA